MEILNHLQDLSEYGMDYSVEEKQLFVDFVNLIKNSGIGVEYMNAPVDMIQGNIVTGVSTTFQDAKTAEEMFNKLKIIIEDTNYFINKSIFIYKLGKVITRDFGDIYTIRIGKLNHDS